jgi:hypothetical protein
LARIALFVAGLPSVRRSSSEVSAKNDHPRFIIADVFCPQIFNLLSHFQNCSGAWNFRL